jgi:hypothetical protein
MLGLDLHSTNQKLHRGPSGNLPFLYRLLSGTRMNRRSVSLSAAVIASFLILSLGAQAAAPECRRVTLSPQPGQIFSMAWSQDGNQLVVTDVSAHRLLRYTPEGRLLGTVEKPAFVHGDFEPTQVHATPNGFVARNSAYEWIWFDRNLKPLRLAGSSLPKFDILDEALFGDDQLAGYGAFRKGDGSWGTGILQVRLRPSLALDKVVEEIPYASNGGNLSSLYLFIVASASGDPYVLRFAEPSYILDVRRGRRLKAFPPGFEHLPHLPQNTGVDSTVPRAKAVEASTLPVALYGRGASLYLLTRQGQPREKTLWKLYRIDTKKDAVIGSFTIPSSAGNLNLTPGPEFWAILEESSMIPSGELRPQGLLLISAAAIDQGGTIPSCN